VDGEGSFTTRGIIKHGHPVPKIFTSKIVSNAEARFGPLPRVGGLIWATRDGWGKGNLTASKKPRVSGDSCGGFCEQRKYRLVWGAWYLLKATSHRDCT
jgi:hypothetical protein